MNEYRRSNPTEQERPIEQRKLGKSEKPGNQEVTENGLEKVQQLEGQLRDKVQAGVSEWLRLSKLREVPAWVRSGLLLTRLFGIETAAAQDIAPPSDELIPALSDGDRRMLGQYLEDNPMVVVYGESRPADNLERVIDII